MIFRHSCPFGPNNSLAPRAIPWDKGCVEPPHRHRKPPNKGKAMQFHSAQGTFTVPVETPVDLIDLIGNVISSKECAALLVSKFGFTETEAREAIRKS
jgi:hypothetical protein